MANPVDETFAGACGNFLLDNISARTDIVNYIIDNLAIIHCSGKSVRMTNIEKYLF
jgi:hypothetical protein